MVDFAKLRNRSSTSFAKIAEAMNKANEGSSNKDDPRSWQPTKDKAGNGSAVIRFLPVFSDDELPWVRMWSHGFKGPTGKWYIENSLTTLDKEDPVGESNSYLWNVIGTEEAQKIVRDRKRRLSYTSKIYVIRDPGNPENEGKVFFFSYGKKIFEKIIDKIQPSFDEDKPVNVFDFWEGADFKLRVAKVEGYSNYDKSTFADPTPLLGGDEGKLEAVVELMDELGPLGDLVAPNKFKSYDELKRRFIAVVGEAGNFPPAEGEAAPAPTRASRRPTRDEAQDQNEPRSPGRSAEPAMAEGEDPDDVDSFFDNLSAGATS